jgi:hypothetical protein
LGNHIEERNVKTFNRFNGQVEGKTVTIKKPIVGILNTVRNVETNHKTVVDLSTGKIQTSNVKKNLHGIGRR